MQDVTNSEDTIPKLFKAIEAGHIDEVRDLIATDPRLASARNKDGASALTWAAYYRHKPICDLLLAAGLTADIFEASAFGLKDPGEGLVKADRAAIGRYSFEGWAPLRLGAHFGRPEVIRLLRPTR